MNYYLKLIFSILLLLPVSRLSAQSGYTVQVRGEDFRWDPNGHEWNSEVYADLYLNGNPIPPSANYFYVWYANPNGPFQIRSSGYNLYHVSPDGHPNQFYQIYADITGPGFMVTSDTITIGKGGTPQNVDVFVKRENMLDLTGNYLKHYTNPHWRDLWVPDPLHVWLTLQQSETIWSDTGLVENPPEKYHHWNDDESDVLNYRAFLIDSSMDQLISWLKSVKSATLGVYLLSASVEKGDIGFKDPWLSDGPELGGIPQNRGTAPLWHTHPSPLVIEPNSGDFYKGIFLNQTVLPGKPYYAVRARQDTMIPFHGQNITWYFQHWETSYATITEPNNPVNGYYESPVIFTQDNATVIANFKGHLASNSAAATAYNNGRRVVVDEDRTWHLVYEDGGNIYYTASTDNGQSWSAETRLSSTASWGKNRSPSIAYHTGLLRLGVAWDREQNGVHFPVFRYKAGSQHPGGGTIPQRALPLAGVAGPEPGRPGGAIVWGYSHSHSGQPAGLAI